MSGGARRVAVWALAAVCMLAPSAADGNIGCLFSASLCAEDVEWCYDDFAFGKCIPVYEDEPERSSLYQYNMSTAELKSFETVLQSLVSLGYRWEHAYTQCVLQAMLLSSRQHLKTVNMQVCEQFSDPDIISESESSESEDEVDPEEAAYVRYTPNDAHFSASDFGNEVYAPPVDFERIDPVHEFSNRDMAFLDEDEPVKDGFESAISDSLYAHGGGHRKENSVNFRRELLDEDLNELSKELDDPILEIMKIKKSYNPEKEFKDNDPIAESYGDTLRSLTSIRKLDADVAPFTAEYITANRYSPEETRILSERYHQRFQAKEFPFEYEEETNDIPESRVYVDEDDEPEADLDDQLTDAQRSNLEYLLSLWKNKIIKGENPFYALYAEGGPVIDQATESTGVHTTPVKKDNDEVDPTYAYVLFNDPYKTDWNRGLEIISRIAQLQGLQFGRDIIDPRVHIGEVTFKVKSNSKNLNASDVAKNVETIRHQLHEALGITVRSAGIGDKIKSPPLVSADDAVFLDSRDNVLVLLIACGVVVAIAGAALVLLIRKDAQARRKFAGLSAAEIDAEATQDYQELCRARMTGDKWSGQQTGVASGAVCGGDGNARVALSRDPDHNPSSARSSTSSWSEEPALTNMDISTGHMVLAYMEDHLKNKDRLEQEWAGLCAYEAEPCATTAASTDDNINKNRTQDILPYDHSRVTLNTLTNQHGSDYINASSITDHDPRNPAYIAAQGPLPHTAADFWQMVWEQGSVVMVMLTRLTEGGTQMCHRYWPEEASELYHIYEVNLVSEHIWCDDYLVRSFYLKNQRTGETRTVTQFHFLSWPEAGVPASTKALLEFRRKVNKSYRGRSCPIIVHCSDGASRTGTYCLIDMVLNRMAKGAKEIDIAATLEHIRDQRPRMVTTKQQFEFVLMAVAEEVHAILKALPAQLQQQHDKKDKEAADKAKHN